MSVNYKNTNNYSALLNEIKASSLNDKVKGRNHKMYVKRVGSQDKSESLTMKGVTSSINDLNQKYASIDLRSFDKKKSTTGGGMAEYTSKTNDELKRRNQSISSGINQNSSSIGNKIDIKISVNYNKPTITNSVNFANSNPSSGLSSSKSFYNTHNPNQSSNAFPQQSNNQSNYTSSNKPETIKNMKQSSCKPENNFNVSSINGISSTHEEKFKEKIIDHRGQLGKSILAASGIGLNHLRNKSQNLNMFDQNSLNISLMGYENKNLKNYLLNQSNVNMSNTHVNSISNANKLVLSHFKYPSVDKSNNQSFAFNNKLISRLNDTNTPKKNDLVDSSFKHADTTDNQLTKGNTEQNVIMTDLNMKDFTLNKNNEDLSAEENHRRAEERDSHMLINKYLILETKLADQLSNLKESSKAEDKATPNSNKNTKNLSYTNLNKRHMTYKKISEEYLTVTQGDNHNTNLLKKLFEGFNETISVLFGSYSKLNEKMADYDNHKILTKKYSDLYKAYGEKSDEIKQLKSMLAQANSSNSSNLPRKIEKERNPNSINEFPLNISNSNVKKTDKVNLNSSFTNNDNNPETGNDTSADLNRSRMIKMMNRNVLDDIDAIYFFDKIDMRSNSASHKKIPKLDFNFLGEIRERESNPNVKKVEKKEQQQVHHIQQNPSENIKHHKKASLKLEDLVASPDQNNFLPGNSAMNANKQYGLLITNQSNAMKYSNYNSNILKSNNLNLKKLSNQVLKIASGQSYLNLK